MGFGLAGKTERTGVFGVPEFASDEEFLARKGFVSEFVDADPGMLRAGRGSSNGETSATRESITVIGNACKVGDGVLKRGGGEGVGNRGVGRGLLAVSVLMVAMISSV